jgi:hypothetical protein
MALFYAIYCTLRSGTETKKKAFQLHQQKIIDNIIVCEQGQVRADLPELLPLLAAGPDHQLPSRSPAGTNSLPSHLYCAVYTDQRASRIFYMF